MCVVVSLSCGEASAFCFFWNEEEEEKKKTKTKMMRNRHKKREAKKNFGTAPTSYYSHM